MSEVVGEAVVKFRTDTTGVNPAKDGEQAGKEYAKGVSSGTKRLAAVVGGAFAASKIAGGIKSLVGGAIEDQASQRRLQVALKNTTGATKEQDAAVESWISRVEVAKGVTDNELRASLQRLVQATGSVTKSQKLMKLAMDASAGTGKPLAAVTAAIAKAQNGNVSSLARLGIQTTKQTKNTTGLITAHANLQKAQEDYDAALKKSGPTATTTALAYAKLKKAHDDVKKAQTGVVKTTLTTDQVFKNMAKTFGGQATARAHSLQGQMDRLRIIFDEAKESLGYKLLPIVAAFATFLIHRAIPAVHDFASDMEERLRPTIERIVRVVKSWQPILEKVIGFIRDNPQTVKAFAVALGVLLTAVYLITSAVAAFNAVLAINPITLVVIALAVLVAAIVYARSHFETFRKVTDALFHAIVAVVKWVVEQVRAHWKVLLVIVGSLFGPIGLIAALFITNFGKVIGAIKLLGRWGTWLWNNVFQPVFQLILHGLALMLNVWGHVLSALGHVPGFGWAKDAGAALQNAADAAGHLADNLHKIPPHKKVVIDQVIRTDTSGVTHSSAGGHSAPELATGGVVRARPGGTLVRLAEAGRDEAVVPLGADPRTATGSGNIIVHGDFVTQAHDYDDFTRQTRARSQMAAFGGRRAAVAS